MKEYEWSIDEVREHIEKLIDRAKISPQFILCGGKCEVVVVSIEQYNKMEPMYRRSIERDQDVDFSGDDWKL